jgi:predicted acyl esterase
MFDALRANNQMSLRTRDFSARGRRRKENIARAIFVLAAAILLFAPCHSAAQQNVSDDSTRFDKTEVMIPMRDGIRLHTEIYTPKDATVTAGCCRATTP